MIRWRQAARQKKTQTTCHFEKDSRHPLTNSLVSNQLLDNPMMYHRLGQDAHAETTAMVGLTSTRLCAAAAVMTKTYLRCIF
jgi:hypothetical protein